MAGREFQFEVEVTRSSNGSVDLRPPRGADNKPTQLREGDFFATADGRMQLFQVSSGMLGKNLLPGEVWEVTLKKVKDAPAPELTKAPEQAAQPVTSAQPVVAAPVVPERRNPS